MLPTLRRKLEALAERLEQVLAPRSDTALLDPDAADPAP